MFEPTSRYEPLEVATLTMPDGRVIAYKRRRFLPQGSRMPLLAEVALAQNERLDLLTARTLGDPEHFWRVCDANDAMSPFAVVELGEPLRIPVPEP